MDWNKAAALLLLVGASAATAGEVSGTFARYDQSKKILTIKVQDQESDYSINDEVRVTTAKGDVPKGGIRIFTNAKVAKAGAPLTVITATKDGKEIVTEIRLGKKK